MYQLVTVTLGKAKSYPLAPGLLSVGRGRRNDIVVKDPLVSRRHAELRVDEDRVTVRDLGSGHGTLINGVPILGPTILRPGDRFQCGKREFILREESAAVMEDTPGPRGLKAGKHLLSEPGLVHPTDRLNVEDIYKDAIQSREVTHALLMAVTEAGQLLTAALPLHEVFDQVLELVARVIPARRIILLTTDWEPVVREMKPLKVAHGQDPLRLSRAVVTAVLEERHALLLNDVPHDVRFMTSGSVAGQKLRSALVAPLFDEEEVVGLLYADHDSAACVYNRDQLRAFTLLANLIAVKISNTRLLDAEKAMARLESELATAARVQRSMLPASIPRIPGYSVAAHQASCREVGGDLYDLARLEDGRVAFVLGDVCGKGMSAALLMSNVIACLRILYRECLDPCCLATRLHQEILEVTTPDYFVTLFFGILDPVNHRLDYVNAGHNPPLLLFKDAPPRMLEATGFPLGLIPGAEYTAASVEVPEGARLCLFSDGIPEALTGTEFYGDDRFLESVLSRRHDPVDRALEGILADLTMFLADTPPSDDITLLLLSRMET